MLIVAHELAAGDPLRDALASVLRVAVGLVWLVAGVRKLRSPEATRTSVAALLGGPDDRVRVVARLLPPAEILLGLVLVVGWHALWASLVSAVAFLGLAGLVGWAAVRHALPAEGCGCFGPERGEIDDAGPRAVARNLVLAILAFAAASGPAP
jgi:uncharacterized membrane protein YphA (DoxX/SURF4 family)